MVSFAKINDIIGYLVLNEDFAIVTSGGDLENSEHVANVVTTLLSLTDRLKQDDDAFNKITVTYKECCYIICLSNKMTYIVKKRYQPPAFSPSDDGIISEQHSVNV